MATPGPRPSQSSEFPITSYPSSPFPKSTWVGFCHQNVEFPITPHTLAPSASVISFHPQNILCWFPPRPAPAVPSGWHGLPPDSHHLSGHNLGVTPHSVAPGVFHTCPCFIFYTTVPGAILFLYLLTCPLSSLFPMCTGTVVGMSTRHRPPPQCPSDTWHIVGASFLLYLLNGEQMCAALAHSLFYLVPVTQEDTKARGECPAGQVAGP